MAKFLMAKNCQRLIAKYKVYLKCDIIQFYHTQINFTEQTNNVIGASMTIKHDQLKWDRDLPEIAVALRTAKNVVTSFTSFFIWTTQVNSHFLTESVSDAKNLKSDQQNIIIYSKHC